MRADLTAMKNADQFPVIVMHADRWRQPIRHWWIVREIGENGIACERLFFECRQDADAIKYLLFRHG